jgi:tRNA threonylcarbamoyladenosine biosynthesis protein TsaB
MKILSVETSTMLGGIAIMDDASGLIAETRMNVKSTHSERLMTEIDHVLKQSGLDMSRIDAFAIAIGPGSFTGLRIGLSTVKGFSYATGRPIVSIPTLDAFAWNFPFSCYPVCTLLDARKKEVYAALFVWEEDGFRKLKNEQAVKISKFLEEVKGLSYKHIIFAGEGAVLYQDEIIRHMRGAAIFASPEKMIPSPSNVAFLALQKAQRGEFSEPVSLSPFYVRKSEAEMKWDG